MSMNIDNWPKYWGAIGKIRDSGERRAAALMGQSPFSMLTVSVWEYEPILARSFHVSQKAGYLDS